MIKVNQQSLVLVVAFLVVMSGCGQATPVQDEILLGAVLPLTGFNSFYGEYSLAAMEIAVADINAAGGVDGRPIRVLLEDSASDSKVATTSAEKVIAQGAQMLVTVTAPMGATLAPVAENHRIPMIYTAVVNEYTKGKKYVFKDHMEAFDGCVMLAKQAIADGHTRIALFGTNVEFTQVCKKGIEHVTSLVAYETYDPGSSDFKTQFTKIKASGADALVLSSFPIECVHAFSEISQLGLDAQIYISFQSFGCGSTALSREHALELEGAIGVDPWINEDHPEYKRLVERLTEKGVTTNIRGSAMWYDMIHTVARSWKGCTDSECATTQFRALKDYKGITGTLSYDGKQVINRPIVVSQFQNGTWRAVA